MERQPKYAIERESGLWFPSELQTNHEFFRDFIDHARNAEDRIWVQNFYTESGENFEEFTEAMSEAASRGVDTRLQVDWYSRLVTKGKPNTFYIAKPTQWGEIRHTRAKTNQMFETMRDSGVQLTFTDFPMPWEAVFPYIGRNHDKTFLVDRTLWKGGVNVNEGEFKKIDFMVKIQDPRIVSVVSQSFDQVNGNKPDRNYAVDITPYYRYLVDRGDHGKSIIYGQALSLLKSPFDRIQYISQIAPNGKFLDHLVTQAEAGSDVDIYLAHRDNAFMSRFPYNLSYKHFLSKVDGVPNLDFHHLDSDVHAKLLLTEREGEQFGMFGSHNLAESGVILGTQESSFLTCDPQLTIQFENYFGALSHHLQE